MGGCYAFLYDWKMVRLVCTLLRVSLFLLLFDCFRIDLKLVVLSTLDGDDENLAKSSNKKAI